MVILLLIWLLLPIVLIPYSISSAIMKSKYNRFLRQLMNSGRISTGEYCRMMADSSENCAAADKAPKTSENNSGKIENKSGTENIIETERKTEAENKTETDIPDKAVYIEAPKTAVTFEPVQPSETIGGFSSAKMLFGIGTTLVILAGFVFSTAIWFYLSDAARMGIIALAGLLFFGISRIARSVLKLPGTSTAFYIISSVFFLTSYFTGAIYRLYGNWFSFRGDGVYIMLAVGALILSGSLMLGNKLYGSRAFISAALYSAAVSATLIIAQISTYGLSTASESINMFILITTLFGAVITALYYIGFKGKFRSPLGEVILVVRVIYALFAAYLWISEFISGQWSAYSAVVLTVIGAELALYGIRFSNKLFISSVSAVWTALLIELSGFADERLISLLILSAALTVSVLLLRYTKCLYTGFSDGLIMAVAFIAALAAACSDFAVPYGIISLSMIEAMLFVTAFDIKNVFCRLSGVVIPLPLAIIALLTADSITSFRETEALSAIASVTLLAFTLCAILFRILARGEIRHRFTAASFEGFACIASLVAAFSSDNLFLCVAAALTSLFLIAEISKGSVNVHSIIPAISVFAAIDRFVCALGTDSLQKGKVITIVSFAAFVLSIVGARIFFPEKCIGQGNKPAKIDIFTVGAVLSVIMMISAYGIDSDVKQFIVLMQMAVIIANCVRKGHDTGINTVLTAFSLFMAAIAFINRPFLVSDNEIIAPKITMLIIFLLGFALRKIRIGGEPVSPTLGAWVYVFDYCRLLWDALANEVLFNTLLVLCISLAILTYSFMAKRKGSFLLSGAGLIGLTLYIMRDFLAEIDWWVYLLLAGILLISIAAVNEFYKDKGESVKAKAGRFFEDWKW